MTAYIIPALPNRIIFLEDDRLWVNQDEYNTLFQTNEKFEHETAISLYHNELHKADFSVKTLCEKGKLVQLDLNKITPKQALFLLKLGI